MDKFKRTLSPRTIGAIYVWLAMCIFFAMKTPIFFEYATFTQVLNSYAITGLVAMGLMMPLVAGLYDLSVGAVVGLAGMASAWSLYNLGPNPLLAFAVGLAVSLIVGAVNAFVILVMKVDSFIATLATSSIVLATVLAASGDNVITGNNESFTDWLATHSLAGLTLPVGLLLVITLILAYLLETTAFGRRLYAIGYDKEVARLSGIRVDGLRAVTLLFSSALAGVAGICAAAALGAGDPTVGPGYLLPAFAAVFLGATQFRGGRFNPWGTVVAVLLLGTADVGLLLIGGPTWSPLIFTGVILIVAVSLTRGGKGGFGGKGKRAPDSNTADESANMDTAVAFSDDGSPNNG